MNDRTLVYALAAGNVIWAGLCAAQMRMMKHKWDEGFHAGISAQVEVKLMKVEEIELGDDDL